MGNRMCARARKARFFDITDNTNVSSINVLFLIFFICGASFFTGFRISFRYRAQAQAGHEIIDEEKQDIGKYNSYANDTIPSL